MPSFELQVMQYKQHVASLFNSSSFYLTLEPYVPWKSPCAEQLSAQSNYINQDLNIASLVSEAVLLDTKNESIYIYINGVYNIGLHVFRRTNENELGTYINTCTIIYRTLPVNIYIYI